MTQRLSIPEIRDRIRAVANILQTNQPHLAEELELIADQLRHVRRRQASTRP